eukprot:CAMPEP_0184656888 /NCGR_PEP_ID=MMETSP0308-20130426/16822_1 /TAXON_ID=38269 /ORGANISM="Gloeochaete witrockiana, Strain SAG 46.84" /LENGTH=246 /DNA_ID=CAMNT_0027094201 /DNA_START=125 /DNA_END=865 /DNA_ORIENTATION=+
MTSRLALCVALIGVVCALSVSGAAVCGNAKVESPETCDDGNRANLDGCSSACRIETGYTCKIVRSRSCCSRCGDGRVGGTERCDDGNTITTDGCNRCLISPGFYCYTCNGKSICNRKSVNVKCLATNNFGYAVQALGTLSVQSEAAGGVLNVAGPLAITFKNYAISPDGVTPILSFLNLAVKGQIFSGGASVYYAQLTPNQLGTTVNTLQLFFYQSFYSNIATNGGNTMWQTSCETSVVDFVAPQC